MDIRVPGYPALIAVIFRLLGRSETAIMAVQAILDLGTCVIVAMLAAKMAAEENAARCRITALWIAALCIPVANYTATPLTETSAILLTAAALLALVSERWLVGGLIAGLAALLRPEAPIVLMAAGLSLLFEWRKGLRAGLWMAVGLFVVLLPWGVRNRVTLGHWQFMTPRYAEMPGEFVPRGFYDWTRTWLVRFSDVYLVPWKIEDEPIPIETINPAAFDSPEERERVAALLEEYNNTLTVTPAMDAGFAKIARERTARHPMRTYVVVPVQRALTMWFTPRLELLPEDQSDAVRIFFGFLNVFYVGLAAWGAWCARRNPGVVIPVLFILVRTVLLTQVEAPEPRYVLMCFPAVLALAAQSYVRRTLPS